MLLSVEQEANMKNGYLGKKRSVLETTNMTYPYIIVNLVVKSIKM